MINSFSLIQLLEIDGAAFYKTGEGTNLGRVSQEQCLLSDMLNGTHFQDTM